MYASDDDRDEFDLEGTTHDPSVLQQTSQIRVSHKARKNVSGISFSWSSKGATDVRNAYKAYFNEVIAEIGNSRDILIVGDFNSRTGKN